NWKLEQSWSFGPSWTEIFWWWVVTGKLATYWR
ncbi:Protein RNA-directed DNA methylation 3, partial [Zea mays]